MFSIHQQGKHVFMASRFAASRLCFQEEPMKLLLSTNQRCWRKYAVQNDIFILCGSGQNRSKSDTPQFHQLVKVFSTYENLWFFWGAKNCGPIPMCSALRKQKERIKLHWTSRNPVVCRHSPMTNSWVLNKNSDLTSDQMLPSSWNVGTAMNPHTNSCTNVQYTINKHHCPAEKIS